jgi:hypothetical protein
MIELFMAEWITEDLDLSFVRTGYPNELTFILDQVL